MSKEATCGCEKNKDDETINRLLYEMDIDYKDRENYNPEFAVVLSVENEKTYIVLKFIYKYFMSTNIIKFEYNLADAKKVYNAISSYYKKELVRLEGS